MITLSLQFSTLDEATDALNKLNGVEGLVAAETSEAPAKAAKETPKAKAAATTKATAGKAKEAPTVEGLKAHILKCAGDGADASDNVKAYVRTFGVAKISDMTDAQRTKAFDGAEAHFESLAPAADEGEDDPMA